ncbi:hypothetical protein FisN_25Lh100 [Fistulifera solaris]|uniref:Inward rectifier potassium channel C-terminal domain-containing protein n=1 Tax=Fistulifera solaris TaxID=1519565 RepID=A0A1Z5J7W7_FISSO|nr:hypothetical protein FisN_25Lh100 [Fistulifera solaris]|eukprot:GAX10049.1 hypothetical protein FisN_25Lh100 [Fistulifera solaris]
MRRQGSFVERVDQENGKENDSHHDVESGLNTETVEEDAPRKRFSSLVNEDTNSNKHKLHKNNNGSADLDTRNRRKTRIHSALIRSNQEAFPQSHAARIKRHFLHFFTRDKTATETHSFPDENNSERSAVFNQISSHGRFFVSTRQLRNAPSRPDITESSSIGPRQYTLATIRPTRKNDWKLLKKLGIPDQHLAVYESTGEQHGSCSCFGIQPNEQVVRYLHWTFRSRFMHVLLSISLIFFSLTLFFALIIYIIAQQQPTCIGGVGTDFGGPEGGTFMDSYSLSWTTFCSVGYGVVHPAVSATEPDRWKCVGMTIFITMEAFTGILFASMCGAILVAKVARIQSFAQVNFSDPIVIRYGSGVSIDKEEREKDDPEMEDNTLELDEHVERIPPPIMEFRINNRLHTIAGGEIIDATVNIIASIDASQACPTLASSKNMRRKGGGKKKKIRRMNHAGKKSSTLETDLGPSSPRVEPLSLGGFMRSVSLSKTSNHAIDEDPTGHLVPRRIFAKLEVEAPDHPFFKRTWILRHELNVSSPLLKAHARQLMRLNQGYWPKQLNSHQQVRDAIHFDQILVNMVGTSNADVSTVSAQHAYDFSDLCVGYRFVNQIFHDPHNGTLQLDTKLINDVTEQVGGGGEELSTRSLGTSQPHDMLVL